jgi:benzodiazapine receptor
MNRTMNRTIADWGSNIAALAIVIVVNGLANAIPLGGQNTGEVSARYPSLFTPAGYTFSIWGLIYTALIIFAIYQALPSQRNSRLLAAITPWFLLSCAGNAGWIFAWHYNGLWLSLALMAVMLFSLVRIYRLLEPATGWQRWAVNIPFSLYTGWITVAIIANTSAVQTGMGWDAIALSAEHWTVVKIAMAGSIAAAVLLLQGDRVFVLVVAWAAGGILVKQATNPEIAGSSLTVLLVALLLVAFESVRKWRRIKGQVSH